MHRKLVLGVGLAALVGGSAAGQPGGFQPVAPPAPAPVLGGFQPLSPAAPVTPPSSTAPLYTPVYSSPPASPGYVPPVDAPRPGLYGSPTTDSGSPPAAVAPPSLSSLPVNIEIPSVLGKDHPWLIKPEHGPHFIMVKSYVRPARDSRAAKEALERGEKGLTARELAEGLASEIRTTYRVQAFLYEYISEERKAEVRAYLIARQKAETEYRAQVAAFRQKAELQGMVFDAPDNKFRVMKHDQRDQIGVLVGGFQTEEDAKNALVLLKKWPTPKNEVLLDKGLIFTVTKGQQSSSEAALINPYAGAFVVPNPTIARATQPGSQKPAFDPFLIKLNEGRPYNLLKATKTWTLGVKSFTAPIEVKGSDTSLVRKPGQSSGADVLAAGAVQAEAMAKALRAMKGPGGQSLNLEAFVLHTRYASLVTIGQFDGPDDPALLATKRMIAGMKLNVSEDQTGFRPVQNDRPLFENLLPVPIPKP